MMINLLRKRSVTVDPFVLSELIANGEAMENETDRLITKVAQLRKENHYLRKGNKVQPHIRMIVRAQAAATLLALWHCSGYLSGRDAAYSFGMSSDDWYKGRALLMVARCWDAGGFTTDDPNTIERQLKGAVERCKAQPDLLGYRIPMIKRPKAFKPD